MKTETVKFKTTEAEREQYKHIAIRDAEGNVSLLLRKAMREYAERHPLDGNITPTAYELHAQA